MQGKTTEHLSIADKRKLEAGAKELKAIGDMLDDASALPECPMTTEESKLLGQIESQITRLTNSLRKRARS